MAKKKPKIISAKLGPEIVDGLGTPLQRGLDEFDIVESTNERINDMLVSLGAFGRLTALELKDTVDPLGMTIDERAELQRLKTKWWNQLGNTKQNALKEGTRVLAQAVGRGGDKEIRNDAN